MAPTANGPIGREGLAPRAAGGAPSDEDHGMRFDTGPWLKGALAGLALLATTAATGDLATYVNQRFGYSIRYPADLFVAVREADNGDGRAFHARRGGPRFLVWAAYNALGRTPADLAAEASRDCPRHRADYRVVKPRLVAVSCVGGDGRVIYQKTLIRGDVLTTFRMTYPSAERSRWDAVLAQISGSLTAGQP